MTEVERERSGYTYLLPQYTSASENSQFFNEGYDTSDELLSQTLDTGRRLLQLHRELARYSDPRTFREVMDSACTELGLMASKVGEFTGGIFVGDQLRAAVKMVWIFTLSWLNKLYLLLPILEE